MRKGILNMAGTICLTAVNTVIGILLARYLEPDGMGQYQLCLTTVILIVTLCNLGVGMASIYFVNNQGIPSEEAASAGFVFSIIAGAFSAVLLFILLQIRSYFGFLPLSTIAILSFGSWVLSFQTSILPLLMAHLRIIQFVSVQILRSILAFVLVCFVILLSLLTVSSALFAQVAGMCGSLALLVWYLRKDLKKWHHFSFKLIKRMIRFGAQFSVGNIINLVNVNIGIYLVRYFYTDDFSYVGHYGRAAAVCSLLLLIPMSLGPILYSRWSGLSLEEKVQQVSLATRLMLILGLSVCVILVFSAKWVVLLMYGSDYLPAVLPLRVLAVGLLFRFISYPMLQLFPSSGHPLLTSILLGTSLVVTAAAMLELIPLYSIAGAAGSVAIGNLFGLIVGYTIAIKKFNVDLIDCFRIRMTDVRYILQNLVPRGIKMKL
jgi:O-antigen/teichoic acid export membrane protein